MDKNNIKYLIIIVISVGITIMFTRLCTNIDGEFDNSIFWNAVSAITGICGFISVIYTLHSNEKTRNIQNRYELRRAYLMEDQREFKRICNEQIERVNPRRLVNAVKSYEDDVENNNLANSIYEYQMNCNELPSSIRFYYKYDNEEIKQFEHKYFDYATKSHGIVQKCADIHGKKNKIDSNLYKEIIDFHEKNYDELRKWIIQLADTRQNYIEEELKNR